MSKLIDFFNGSIKRKMILAFCTPTIVLFVVNLMLYMSTNRMLDSLGAVYSSNQTLNELSENLDGVQQAMEGYLNTKTSDVMEEYYVYEQDYSNLLSQLNEELYDDETKIMERNIKNMSETYLDLTGQAVDAKRGGNVEKYKSLYDEATRLYGYISANIFSLNNMLFVNNSNSYTAMMGALSSLEVINIGTLVIIAAANLIFVVLFATTIVERDLKEQELLMETHLKDAKLKYLQAQINPHFLFNTLNAGAQLAMMEGAENTGSYMLKVADFFRYNIKKNHDVVPLREEIEMVETYIYILNVRFSGDIHFEKEVDDTLLDVPIPSMILQPIVENSVNYGIRNIEWEGKIKLSVYLLEDNVCVSIADNGVGIPQDKIEKLLSGTYHSEEVKGDSNGIGLDNCINRLSIFYNRDDVMDIISEGENKGTETILYLPLIRE